MSEQPTMHLRFVKRKVGRNVVRILQQLWQDADAGAAISSWRDVTLAGDDGATKPEFPSEGSLTTRLQET